MTTKKSKSKSKTKAVLTPNEHIEIDDMFSPKPTPNELGGMEKVKHDVELLQMEWAIKHPDKTVTAFLSEVKGYRRAQVQYIFSRCPLDEFKKAKERIMNQLTTSMVKRHVDIMAETQDAHLRGEKLNFTRVIEMLSKGGVPMIDRKTGEPKVNEAGKPIIYPLRSIDLLNCASALEKCQKMWRTAMGFKGEEGEGMTQILEKITQLQNSTNVTNNSIHITNNTQVVNQAQDPTKYTYEEIKMMIEIKREQKRKLEGEQKVIEIKQKDPEGGDFTALPQIGVRNR